MGLLDALFSNDSGGGLLGGLPQSWQWQNPADANSNKDFLAALQQDPSMGNNLVAPQSPFGPVPNFAQPQSVFASGAAPVGFNPSLLTPQAPQMQPQQQPAPMPQQAAPAPLMTPAQDVPDRNVNVGGYQMPQFGSPPPQVAQAEPRATDFSAQAAQREQPEQALPPALQSPNFLSRIGSPDGLIARLTGNDTRSISQQNLRATFDATRNVLRQSGMSDQEATSKAMLAVLNPEAGKVILPEALSNRNKFEKLKDGFGNENPVFVDTVNHTVTTADGKPYGQGGGATGDFQGITDKITDMRSRGASTEQMLKMIPTGYRDDVASLISGKAVPANMGRSEVRGKLITLAKTVDPNFDETLIPTRIAMRKDFAGEGKNGISIGNFNTAAHHIDKASDALERMAPYQGDYPTINAIRSYAAGNLNTNPQLRDATAELNNSMNAVDHEVAAAYNSGHLSDSDRQSWEKLKNPNLPPDVLRRGLSDFVDLLNGKRDSLNHMYQQTFHEDAPTIDKETNAAITAKVHSRLPGYAKEQAPSSTGGIPSGWSVKVR